MQASPRPVLMQVPLAMPSLPKRLPRPVGIRRRPRHCTKLGQSNLGLGFAGLMDFHTSLGWFKQAPFQCEHCFGASGFQLSQAVCSSDFDREYVTSAICRWYGSPAARLMFLKARLHCKRPTSDFHSASQLLMRDGGLFVPKQSKGQPEITPYSLVSE